MTFRESWGNTEEPCWCWGPNGNEMPLREGNLGTLESARRWAECVLPGWAILWIVVTVGCFYAQVWALAYGPLGLWCC